MQFLFCQKVKRREIQSLSTQEIHSVEIINKYTYVHLYGTTLHRNHYSYFIINNYVYTEVRDAMGNEVSVILSAISILQIFLKLRKNNSNLFFILNACIFIPCWEYKENLLIFWESSKLVTAVFLWYIMISKLNRIVLCSSQCVWTIFYIIN